VLWAIRDRGAQDRPGRPRDALYAYKLSGGRVGEVADGARFTAIPLPATPRTSAATAMATSGSPTSATTSVTATTPPCSGARARSGPAPVADLISRPPAWTLELAAQSPGPTNVEGVAFAWDSHDLNLLAENRDVFYVPAAAYER
jgi:hypothetical protein